MEKSAKHAAARRGYRLAKCCSLCFYADATKEGIECAFNASNKDDQRPASAIHVCDEFVQISVRQEAKLATTTADRDQLRAQLAAVTAERDKWRALVMAHNSALEIKCRSWQSGGYCSAPGRPHACHDCPLDWKIDVPSEAGSGDA